MTLLRAAFTIAVVLLAAWPPPAAAVDDKTPAAAVDDKTPAAAVDDKTPAAAVDDKTPAAAVDDTTRVQTSRAVVTEFLTSMKQQLRRALQMGGPPNAIQVCTVAAPAIAADLSTRTGGRVGRTSLKPRNPDNAPDDWERATLQAFEQRRHAGEDPRGIEAYATVVGADGPEFRYMKAIPMGGNCLACHGQVLDRSVAATLAQRYPDDKATGYNVGDIRGAFTIVQPK